MLVAAFVAMGASQAMAATDITEALTEVGTYKTSAIVIGIAIFLFVLGRKVVKRLV